MWLFLLPHFSSAFLPFMSVSPRLVISLPVLFWWAHVPCALLLVLHPCVLVQLCVFQLSLLPESSLCDLLHHLFTFCFLCHVFSSLREFLSVLFSWFFGSQWVLLCVSDLSSTLDFVFYYGFPVNGPIKIHLQFTKPTSMRLLLGPVFNKWSAWPADWRGHAWNTSNEKCASGILSRPVCWCL